MVITGFLICLKNIPLLIKGVLLFWNDLIRLEKQETHVNKRLESILIKWETRLNSKEITGSCWAKTAVMT